MIDRIREDIEQRLEQLLAEADKLRQALSALGSSDGNVGTPSRRGRSTGRARTSTRARTRGVSAAATGARRGRPARQSSASATRGGGSAAPAARTRTASGATRRAVLDALAKANGQPLTAGQVASSTGLGRPSVSTTLSKLARSGEVVKAQRGYAIGAGPQKTGG
jgi:DNA-binding transcriptional ArsR family regulator